jgi:tetratricopeptide (TPR) repeat protein
LERFFRIARQMFGRRHLHDERPAASDGSSAAAVLQSAFRLHQSGQFEEALRSYRNAIEIDPTADVAYNLLGALLCSLGQLKEGEACFRRAIDLNASNAEALNNLASVRKEQGDLLGAEALYRQTLELQPKFSDAWNNLGLVYFATGRLPDAERCFRQTLHVNPHNGFAHNNLAAALRRQGLLAEAEVEFRSAIAANPDVSEAWSGLGDILAMSGLLDEAEICCNKALELRPTFPDATNNLATIAKARRQFDVAISYCDDVLRSNPRHLGALNNLGEISLKHADYGTAEMYYRRALRIDAHHAVTRFNLAALLLMRGNYLEGFELYESRFDASGRHSTLTPAINEKLHSYPQWRGDSLGGKRLLLWAEQGLGDCIMMLRYLPELRARGVTSVMVLCPAALVRLVRSMSVAEQVVSFDEASTALNFDTHCPMMSLPTAFGSRIDTVPDHVPYLHVPQTMIAALRERLSDNKPKVGIAWAGSATLQDDARRSIPIEQFAQLLSLNTVQFLSLQKGEAAQDWRKTAQVDSGYIDRCTDLLDTAALVMNLDLVISVDTAVAHLAGALGRPVWLLNRWGSEWRWGVEGQSSPWYPTMTIFRQMAPGSWGPVLETIRNQTSTLFSRDPQMHTCPPRARYPMGLGG